MSGASSSGDEWFTRLDPVARPQMVSRDDYPRLGEFVEWGAGSLPKLQPGRAVLLGFPQDEGVRRNHGRAGAALGPSAIRNALYRLPTWDPISDADLARPPPLDLGDVRMDGSLEETQQALGEVVAAVLQSGAVPIVLGGGHETAFGHYLGYVKAQQSVGIINVDAHLDVRPCLDGLGHSGSPFRQIMELPGCPMPGDRYVCLGGQPHGVSRIHLQYLTERNGRVYWADQLRTIPDQERLFRQETDRLRQMGCAVYLSIDADVVRDADVLGVSAPNPLGLCGSQVIAAARLAGTLPGVASLDVVEINPHFDRDGQSARWAAMVIWSFLIGMQAR